ncbi:MAG: zinc ribbon domain-containing protein, partial [Gemmatimonadaceae bacterium]
MADQLERLFRILVRRIRDLRPEHLSRAFEVGEILRTFVPYRSTRVEVGVETAEDYEVLILRLLSGERGLLFADDAMQEDLRHELDSGNPDLRALHAYGTARVTLAQHAMRQVLESATASAPETRVSEPTPAPSTDGVPGGEHGASDVPHEVAAGRERGGRDHAMHAPPSGPSEISAALDAIQRQLPPTLAELGEALGTAGESKSRPSYVARGTHIPDPTADAAARTPRPGCRFCGQMLPEGRTVTFCPHCGQNLKVHRCPGCSAEVDP